MGDVISRVYSCRASDPQYSPARKIEELAKCMLSPINNFISKGPARYYTIDLNNNDVPSTIT